MILVNVLLGFSRDPYYEPTTVVHDDNNLLNYFMQWCIRMCSLSNVLATASFLALSKDYWIVFDISSQMVYNGYRNVV